ncbi:MULTISPECIES: metallophosphoesterase [unclassified Nocardia]|uniref:metallophosphoesterase n=1 Tax=unclassified Nocardia TaxID=2637762 RepID=UPI001CE3D211|nr:MULTISPECIES: metallophosphoesterase [unclassified Nocardia]
MSRYGPSRRTVFGVLAATAAVPGLLAARPGSFRAQRDSTVATGLEVVTITDRSVIVTWNTIAPDTGMPLPADTELWIGPADSGRRPVLAHSDPAPTAYHYAEVDGLEPGRSYRFEAWSGGVRATAARNVTTQRSGRPESSGVFTTLVPPPGRLLRTFVLANDIHYGEPVSGLVLRNRPRGVRQDPGHPPYSEVMLDATLADARAHGANHLIVAGDLTNEALPDECRGVRAHLDTWGALGADYFVCRGNHDRPHIGPEYRTGPAVPGSAHHDCWGANFLPHQELQVHEVGGLRLLGLDTTDLDASGGRIEPRQFDHLRTVLRAEPDRPTLVFGHHPVTRDSAFTNLGGPGFVLDRRAAARLQELYRTAPGVFLQHSGHTHRTRRSTPDIPLDVEFLEVAAVKEYPGGYCLLRVHEGGYQINFYKTRTDAARRWSTRTRCQYFGLLPGYALGSTADRNHVVLHDFSGLTAERPEAAAARACTAAAPDRLR